MVEILKKISPTHEPFIYFFLLLAAYQLFVQKMPITQEWFQYAAELLVAIGGRQLVRPLAKENANARGN